MSTWYYAAAAYLVFGLYLTHGVFAGMHRPRRRLRDWVLGAVSMPVLFVAGLIFMACEKTLGATLAAIGLRETGGDEGGTCGARRKKIFGAGIMP